MLVLLAGILAGAYAQPQEKSINDSIEERRIFLEYSAKAVEDNPNANLLELRSKIRDLKAQSAAQTAEFRESRKRIAEELETLGPPPEEGAPPESEEIAARRAQINQRLANVDAIVRQADLNMALADRLLGDIADARREQFYSDILRDDTDPFSLEVVHTGVVGFLEAVERAGNSIRANIAERDEERSLTHDIVVLTIALALAFILFWPVRARLNRTIANYQRSRTPTPSRRVAVASAQTVARVVPGVIGGAIIFWSLIHVEIIDPSQVDVAELTRTIWLGFLAVLAVDGAVSSVFSPHVAGWQVLPLRWRNAFLVRILLIFTAVLIALDQAMEQGVVMLGAPQETAFLQRAAVALVLSVLIFILSRPRLWRRWTEEGEQAASTYLTTAGTRSVPLMGLLLSLFCIATVALSYVALSHFVATRTFMLAGLLAGAWYLRAILREVIGYLAEKIAPDVEHEHADDGDEEPENDKRFLAVWLNLMLDLALLVALVPPALLVLGAEWVEVRDGIIDAFFGIEIGSVTISIADILTAIAVFAVILWVTKVIQRTAEERLFPATRLDDGIRNSFRTLIGYVGITIAGLTGIGVIGADLSNLAIVAGALSVGIGFGLQSIVSNFVSGLILLFERPIKVGDWISVPSGEGTVRRISVRSTEIEKFDRSSVIVPNSELISGSVTNMTLGNKIGRLIVPVGVSYDSDPDKVISILKDIAYKEQRLLKYPEPWVYFAGLGDSSINFEIRGFVRDVATRLQTDNDIRLAVFKRLRAEKIEIPFPQRVVHMHPLSPAQPQPGDEAIPPAAPAAAAAD